MILLLYYYTVYRRSGEAKSEDDDPNNPMEYKEPPNIILSLPTENIQPGENESLCEVATVA